MKDHASPPPYPLGKRYLWHWKRWKVVGGRLVSCMQKVPVILMAREGKWCMVRRPRSVPFVTHVDDLTES
jgi:hypothetical protein